MTDDQKDPTEREHVDDDLEMDADQAEGVKGGADLNLTRATTTTTTTTTTQVSGSLVKNDKYIAPPPR